MSSGSCGVSVVSLGQHTQIHTQQQLDETEKHNFVCVAVHFLHLNILWKQLSNTRGRPAVATRKQRQGQKQATEELAGPRGAHSSVCLMWLLQAELLPGQVSPWDVNWRSCDFESVSPFWLVARWLGDYVPRCGAQCLLCGGLVLFKLHIFYWVTWVAVSLKLPRRIAATAAFLPGDGDCHDCYHGSRNRNWSMSCQLPQRKKL